MNCRLNLLKSHLRSPGKSPEAAENNTLTMLRPILSNLCFLGSDLLEACFKLSYL